MGVQAALRCLANAGVDKSAVDLIIVACASPDQMQPAVACLVQEKLGIAAGQCPAFDVNSVCAGFVFALNVAQGMMLAAPSAISKRAHHRERRLFQDPQLGRSANLCLLRRRRGSGVVVADPQFRFTDAFPPWKRRSWKPPHRGAGGRHPHGRGREGSREAVEQIQDGWPESLGVCHRNGSANHSRTAWRSRANAGRSRICWSCTRAISV